MTRLPLVAVVALFAFTASLPAAEESKDFSLDGWVGVADMDKAIAAAKEKDRGLVFMYISRSAKADQIKLAESWGRDASLGSMIRVLAYTDTKGSFEKLRKQVADDGKDTPRLYFATPDLAITGYLSPREPRRLRAVAGLASSIDSWRKSMSKELAKADQLVELGRFGAAMKIIDEIANADLAYTAQVIHTWESLPPTDAEKERAKDKDTAPRAGSNAPPAHGYYVPTLRTDKTEAYQAKATQRLADARKAHAEGNAAEARKLAAPLASDGGDFPEAAEARKLLAEIAADASKPPQKPDDGPPPDPGDAK